MLNGKGNRYRQRGGICYRIDARMRRGGRGRSRAVWLQRGNGPWRLASLYDGGARQVWWEMNDELGRRANRYAHGLFEQYGKALDQRDQAREERAALLKEGDDLRNKLLVEDLRLCLEARTLLHDELTKSKQFRRLEKNQHTVDLDTANRSIHAQTEYIATLRTLLEAAGIALPKEAP